MTSLRPFCLLAALTLSTAPAAAQNGRAKVPEPRYIPFEFTRDLSSLVEDRPDWAKDLDLEPFKDIIDAFTRDPEKLKLLEKFDVNDPALQEQVKQLLDKQPAGKRPSPEQLKKLQGQLEKIKERPTESRIKPNAPDAPQPAPLAPPGPFEPLAEPPRDVLKEWLQSALENADETQLGDWLRDSPTWRGALENLRGPVRLDGTSGETTSRLGRVVEGLKLPDRLPAWGERLAVRLRDLPRPKLRGLGNLRAPRFAAPAMPGRPVLPPAPSWSAASMGTVATWLLCLVLLGLLGWYATKWLQAYTPRRRAGYAIGPWPIDPALIATRTDLIRAFDYLAQLRLGPQARASNHRSVAERLADPSAERLADLYETARYTEGAEALPDADRDQARRALRSLSETVPA